MSGKKKRPPLEDIHAGSGITAGPRPPSIWDDEYRDKALRGALVDGRVNRTPAPTFDEFRRDVEDFCRDTFKEENLLDDPFSLIHPEGRFSFLDGKWVMAKGLDYIKSRFDLGYHLAANWHSRGEDHSQLDGPAARRAAKFWYAARLAAELTTFDILVARLRANDGTPEELLMYAVQTGAELGRLDKERRLKFKHEPAALHGQKFPTGRTDAATKGRTKKGEKRAKHVIDMARRILKTGGGRFKNGRINQSLLANRYVGLAEPGIGKERARQIIRDAIRRGELV